MELGLILEQEEGRPGVYVVNVSDCCDAARCGVRAGDRLLAVDGSDVSRASIEEIAKLTSLAGSVVSMRVMRAGESSSEPQIIPVRLQRKLLSSFSRGVAATSSIRPVPEGSRYNSSILQTRESTSAESAGPPSFETGKENLMGSRRHGRSELERQERLHQSSPALEMKKRDLIGSQTFAKVAQESLSGLRGSSPLSEIGQEKFVASQPHGIWAAELEVLLDGNKGKGGKTISNGSVAERNNIRRLGSGLPPPVPPRDSPGPQASALRSTKRDVAGARKVADSAEIKSETHTVIEEAFRRLLDLLKSDARSPSQVPPMPDEKALRSVPHLFDVFVEARSVKLSCVEEKQARRQIQYPDVKTVHRANASADTMDGPAHSVARRELGEQIMACKIAKAERDEAVLRERSFAARVKHLEGQVDELQGVAASRQTTANDLYKTRQRLDDALMQVARLEGVWLQKGQGAGKADGRGKTIAGRDEGRGRGLSEGTGRNKGGDRGVFCEKVVPIDDDIIVVEGHSTRQGDDGNAGEKRKGAEDVIYIRDAACVAEGKRREAAEVMKALLQERDAVRSERNAALSERDAALGERDAALSEMISARSERDAALGARDVALLERDALVSERDALLQDITASRQETVRERQAADSEKEALRSDASDRIKYFERERDEYVSDKERLMGEIGSRRILMSQLVDLLCAGPAVHTGIADSLAVCVIKAEGLSSLLGPGNSSSMLSCILRLTGQVESQCSTREISCSSSGECEWNDAVVRFSIDEHVPPGQDLEVVLLRNQNSENAVTGCLRKDSEILGALTIPLKSLKEHANKKGSRICDTTQWPRLQLPLESEEIAKLDVYRSPPSLLMSICYAAADTQ